MRTLYAVLYTKEIIYLNLFWLAALLLIYWSVKREARIREHINSDTPIKSLRHIYTLIHSAENYPTNMNHYSLKALKFNQIGTYLHCVFSNPSMVEYVLYMNPPEELSALYRIGSCGTPNVRAAIVNLSAMLSKICYNISIKEIPAPVNIGKLLKCPKTDQELYVRLTELQQFCIDSRLPTLKEYADRVDNFLCDLGIDIDIIQDDPKLKAKRHHPYKTNY